MIIVVFSDTHLRLPFEEEKFRFLEKLVAKADQVIINGDFWDGYIISFDQFINSPWQNLFPLLKKKKTIYVLGNHDKRILSDKRVSLFSHQQKEEYLLKINGSQFVFQHGHQLAPALDDVLKLKKVPAIIQKRLINFHDRQIRKKGKEFLRKFFKKNNEKIKKKIKSRFKNGQIIICGHTHYPEIDLKNHFACCGTIAGGFASYLLIDERGRIRLREEGYGK
jgi:predicted phosphodiesterase